MGVQGEPTQSTLSDGDHLPSVCRCQLPQPGQVLGFSVVLKLTAAGRVAADGAVELTCGAQQGHRHRATDHRLNRPSVQVRFTSGLCQSDSPPAVLQASRRDHKL